MPSLNDFTWIRGAPGSGLATLISRISRRIAGGHSRPATTMSRLPTRIRSKTGAMPADNGIRFYDRQCIANSREQPIEADEYPSVDGTEGEFLWRTPRRAPNQ